MRAEDILNKKIIKIYEGIRAQIKEDVSIDDVNTKLDVIMDALGLTTDNDEKIVKEKEEEETVVEEEPTTDNNKEEKKIDDFEEMFNEEEDKEKTAEGLDYKQARYEIQIMQGAQDDFQIYDSDKDLVSGQSVNRILFDSFDNLVEYLNKRKYSVSYMDMQTLVENNEKMDKGLLLIKPDFDIIKNAI